MSLFIIIWFQYVYLYPLIYLIDIFANTIQIVYILTNDHVFYCIYGIFYI